MFTLIRRLALGLRHSETCRTKDEAIALALQAAAKARIDHRYWWATVRRLDSRLTWIVSTATIGSGWSVNIDDATGEVGPVKRWGVR
jgi:hypothetical protein